MHPFDELKSYIGFDGRDEDRLHAFWPELEPHITTIIEHFYERIESFEGTASVMESTEQVARLKRTLERWLEELVRGPHDLDYYLRRQRIGRRHVEVALEERFMFGSMSVMRQDLCDVARQLDWDQAEINELCVSLERVTSLDLAVMTGTYVEAREINQLATLQHVLVSHLPVTVMMVSASGIVVAATPASVRLGGVDLTGARYVDALPAALVEAADLEVQVDAALKANNQISLNRVDAEVDGRPRSFQLTIVPLDHPQARFLLHLEELTEAVEIESRLSRTEALAQLGALSAAVAHELRNPLAGISGAIQVISGTLPEDDPRSTIMDKIEQQIQRLNILVTDLLAFARPGTANLSTIDLREVAEVVAELLRGEHPRVMVRVEGRGEAHADPNLVHQILLNLVQNAAAAVDEVGQVLVRVEDAQILVCDDGDGVPTKKRSKIFQPFFTTRSRGTGLGLAISLRAARLMGGTLTLLDEGPMPGATFCLCLSAHP